ncbi:MFS transporter, partial [Pseudomonas syringae pv. tagetis]
MIASLIVLGLARNLTNVERGALLALSLNNNPRTIQLQGKKELVIALFATNGAFTRSILKRSVGSICSNAKCIAIS